MNNITVQKIKRLNQYLDVVLGVPILVAWSSDNESRVRELGSAVFTNWFCFDWGHSPWKSVLYKLQNLFKLSSRDLNLKWWQLTGSTLKKFTGKPCNCRVAAVFWTANSRPIPSNTVIEDLSFCVFIWRSGIKLCSWHDFKPQTKPEHNLQQRVF